MHTIKLVCRHHPKDETKCAESFLVLEQKPTAPIRNVFSRRGAV
jgi:hypothetical protein